jgi:hypothetical protein
MKNITPAEEVSFDVNPTNKNQFFAYYRLNKFWDYYGFR